MGGTGGGDEVPHEALRQPTQQRTEAGAMDMGGRRLACLRSSKEVSTGSGGSEQSGGMTGLTA